MRSGALPDVQKRTAPTAHNATYCFRASRPLRSNAMGLITNYNLRSMIVRKGTAAMTAGGIAMVVSVFVMTLAIAQGFKATLVASGSPQNAIVLRKGATAESLSAVARADVPLVETLPQVARAG